MKSMIALLLAAAATTSPAQTVWRCGPGGTQFQATPCAGGQTVTLRPAPDAAAAREARGVAQRERQALQALAEERRAREREAAERGLGPAGIRPRPVAPPRRTSLRPLPTRQATSPKPAAGGT